MNNDPPNQTNSLPESPSNQPNLSQSGRRVQPAVFRRPVDFNPRRPIDNSRFAAQPSSQPTNSLPRLNNQPNQAYKPEPRPINPAPPNSYNHRAAQPQPAYAPITTNSPQPTSSAGFRVPATAVAQTHLRPTPKSKSSQAYQIFYGSVIILAVLNLLAWIISGIKGDYESFSFIMTIILMAMAGAKLFELKVIKRYFMIAASLMLILSLFGTYDHFREVHKYNTSQNSNIIGLKTAINHYQNDYHISSTQRAKYIAVLKRSEAIQRSQLYTIQLPLTNVLASYALALTPLVFFSLVDKKLAVLKGLAPSPQPLMQH